MDFTQGSAITGSGSANFGERTSSITSEHSDGTCNTTSLHNLSDRPNTMLSSTSLLRQPRPASDFERQDDRRGPFKLARVDSFPSRHVDLEMQMNSSDISNALMYHSSIRSDGHLGSSGNNSPASSGILLGYNLSSDVKPSRGDNVVSSQIYSGGAYAGATRYGGSPYQDYNTNSSVPSLSSMRRDAVRSLGGPGPFSADQWVEFNQQTFIFKHIAAGVNPPPTLLLPIISSVASLSRYGVSSMQAGSNPAGIGAFSLGAQSSTDPEPGRCRRTDGKKWRCAREVVLDQKYCERHMHRGRHRSRTKPADTQASSASQSLGAVAPSNSNAAPSSTTTTGNVSSQNGQVASQISAGMNVQRSLQLTSSQGTTHFSSAHPSSSSPTLALGSQLQFSLQPAGVSEPGNRSIRSLEPEQMLSSDAAGLKRLLQNAHTMSNLSMMNSVDNASKILSSQSNLAFLKAANAPKTFYNLPQMKSLCNNVDVGAMPKGERVNQLAFSAAVNASRETEDLPFRHFMNDWPRSRDSSTLSWSDLDEQKSSRTASSTELSMSNLMPMDIPSSNVASPRAKSSSSPLRLSMTKGGGEEDLLGVDAIHMGLSMGVGANDERLHRQQASWVPIAWENPVGGPLGEVLQSSTPRGTAACKSSSSGLNLLGGEGWDGSPKERPGMASPTGVLQKTTFGSYSDSSSSGSSPRSALKPEPGHCDINIRSPNGPSILSS